MADTSERASLDDSQEIEQENYWSLILNDVAVTSARVGPSFSKNVLVLGNVTSGKTSLIDKLCEVSKTKAQNANGIKLNGCSLEYRYIDVRDEDVEDSVAYMDVWLLDGVEYQEQLLHYVLSKEKCLNTLVVIAVDLSQPWEVMDSLQRWTEVVRMHLNSLNIPHREYADMQEAVQKHFQSYTDPEETQIPLSGDSSSPTPDSNIALPLDDSVLTHNLGIPLIVVCCKTDLLDQVEKSHGYKSDHIDFIQQHIRRFCLNYGAGLVYTAAKDSKNVSLLYKYLIHRTFGLPFRSPAHVVDKDAVFIPSGWDNEKKIDILNNHIQVLDPKSEYSDIIKSQTITKMSAERQDTSAQDDQVFLIAQKAHLDRAATKPSSAAAGSPSKSEGHQRTTSDGKHEGETAAATPQVQDQKVLADFFNQLLAKRPAGSKGSSLGSKSPSSDISKKDKPVAS